MERNKPTVVILGEVRRVVVDKDEVPAKVLLAILTGDHTLPEDIPGVSKTTMALVFSKALGLRYNRVQFIPDVVSSDITGFTLYNKEAGQMEYQSGTVLHNLFLTDEPNRATNHTQSALLKAMEEEQITVDGVSHPVSQPFPAIAAQGPTGASGTQFLPDSQMDRSMARLSIGYPTPADGMAMMCHRQGGILLEGVRLMLEFNGLPALRAQAEQIYVSDEVLDYIVRLVGVTRSHSMIPQGASPRAALTLTAMAKAAALMRGQGYVLPENVSLVFGDVVSYRLFLSSCTGTDRPLDPVSELLERVLAPRIS